VNEPEITSLRARLLVLNELRKERWLHIVRAARLCPKTTEDVDGTIHRDCSHDCWLRLYYDRARTIQVCWKGVLYSGTLASLPPSASTSFGSVAPTPCCRPRRERVALGAIIPTVLLLERYAGKFCTFLHSDSAALVLDDDKPAPVILISSIGSPAAFNLLS